MYRHFVIIALSLSFVVTACNNSGKKRVSLRKSPLNNDAKASDRTKAINNALGDPKCFRVDKLINEFMKLKDENVLIYTSDVNIGNFNTISDLDTNFVGETDLKIRASAVLASNSSEPVIESVPAEKLLSSSIGGLMSISSMDAQCSIVAIRGAAATPNFKVIKKGPDSIWLRNLQEPTILLRYEYNRVDKLIVTQFKADQYFCGKHGGIRMIKYVVAREGAMQSVELNRDFANAIASVIKAPAEFTAELTETAAARSRVGVSLKTETMNQVRQLLNSDGFTPAVCP